MPDVTRDEHLSMTLVSIQMENRLFRVFRHLLETRSRIFRDMLSLPSTGETEGSSDNNPIRLEGIEEKDFKRFLEALILCPCQPERKGLDNFEVWFPVLKLSWMLEVDDLHQRAIEKMDYKSVPKTAAEKVVIALEHDIGPWLLPGLNELARRKEPIGIRDVDILGLEIALKVAAVRESLTVNDRHDTNRPVLSSGARVAHCIDFTQTIKRVFRIQEWVHFTVLV